MRNLVHDTAYRRTRAAATAAVHRLDEAVNTSRDRRRVLFEAASPMSLSVFMPLYSRLREDARLQFWFSSPSRTWTPDAIFAGIAGDAGRVFRSEQLRWKKFDAYINTDFWDMTWLPRRARRVHLFHGVAGKYGLDAPVRIAPVVRSFDRLLFPNVSRRDRYITAGLAEPDEQAALIGYPKVDCLVDGSLDRRATLARLGIDIDRPVVLYAPTWSPFSSLNSVGAALIAAVGRLDVTLIVKLHDRSYDTTARASGGVDWSTELEALCTKHGAHLVRDADASPWLHAADLLITDHSSVGFEFMLLDRPIVVLDCPELLTQARVNRERAAQLRAASFIVQDIGALCDTLREALAQPQAHSAVRRRTADALFYRAGTATARALECIYDLIELPRPADLGINAEPDRVNSWSEVVPAP